MKWPAEGHAQLVLLTVAMQLSQKRAFLGLAAREGWGSATPSRRPAASGSSPTLRAVPRRPGPAWIRPSSSCGPGTPWW